MATTPAGWALITGASGGIGEEFARQLAALRYHAVVVARSEEKLLALAEELRTRHQTDVLVLPMDLSEPGAAIRLAETIAERNLSIDVLVNNAGFGDRGPFATCDWDRANRMIQLNITALTELTRFLLPGMLQRKRGRILNVASTAAFQPGPFMAVYFATKAFVLSFSEALHEELRDTGVTATALCPGPTESGFFDAARMDGASLFQRKLPSSQEVAAAGLQAMFAGQRTIVHGLQNRIGTLAARFVPKGTVLRITRKMVE